MAGKPQAKIAFVSPLTGDQSIVGIPMCQCAELAVDQANRRGDLPFHLILQAEDDCADPATAEVIARRLVDDPAVIGVIGHKNSGPSAAAAPIYHAAGLVQITPSSTNPQLSRRGYRTFFRLCAHDAVQGSVAARYAIYRLGAKNIAVIHDGTDYGQPLGEVVQSTVTQCGGTVVLFEPIRVGDRDFRALVARIRAISPDLVYFAMTEVESSILVRQLRAAGVESIFFGAQGSSESKFLQLAGPAARGSYHTYAGVEPYSSPSAQNFIREFNARFGPIPSYGPETYDAAKIIIAGLARAGKADRQHVLEEVRRIRDFEGVTGRINFDPNGDRRDATVSIWREQGGKLHLLGLEHDPDATGM